MIEYIDVLDEHMQPVGVATREEIHQKGYWHQTFHCCVMLQGENQDYILFQKRHPRKQTFPNKLDISAAGHLLQGETVEDGLRELEEELGITAAYKDLLYLGVYKANYETESLLNREFNHLHLLKSNLQLSDFNIQRSELSGLYKIEWRSFLDLLHGNKEKVRAIGFEYNLRGEKIEGQLDVSREDFAAQDASWDGYFRFVFETIEKVLG